MRFILTIIPNRPLSRTVTILGMLFWLLAGPVLGEKSGNSEWVGGYSSTDAGSETPVGSAKIYPLQRLEKLRRAVAPRYVRVLDWQEYDKTSQPVNKGILFTYADYRAETVLLAGNFSNWRPLKMRRNRKGVFYHILPIREIENGVRFNSRDHVYRYKFLVDGIWTHDPRNKNRIDDGLGSYVSEFRPTGEDVPKQISVRVLAQSRGAEDRLVEFAIYLPDAKNLSLVGTFNNWNPEHDLLAKGEDGVFRLRLRLKPGQYAYKYIADGRWILDQYNPHTRYFEDIGELCSHVSIE